MPTLYFSPHACSIAPHILLEWIGQPYVATRIATGSPELIALNPAGAVPVLQEDDGWVLTQAGAILDYLAHKHPGAGLSGGDSLRDRAEAHRWASFLTGDLHGSYWPFFMPDRYTTDTSDSAKEHVVAAARKLVAKKLDLLEDHMAGREWFLGAGKGKRSYVDAYAFPMLGWARQALPDGLGARAQLKDLHARLAADPAVKKVIAAEKAA
ncbi:glutathione S-transferase family protein [Paracoccus aminophilus]|uniref:Glutathione S-transferase n=1 Tax=Paracoccus aminophilus JCM 7686 TaxID=1367847 RepID=S5Y9R5_PARAH|nr:glutathione S-transferase family protein [Paracoccus aminophilus]AGT08083.1 glutathione S-transferase [Paracoccus aminophilus JCM 7686]